ncbi:hypothetical protein HK100_001732, partial [Physocladia obscura]
MSSSRLARRRIITDSDDEEYGQNRTAEGSDDDNNERDDEQTQPKRKKTKPKPSARLTCLRSNAIDESRDNEGDDIAEQPGTPEVTLKPRRKYRQKRNYLYALKNSVLYIITPQYKQPAIVQIAALVRKHRLKYEEEEMELTGNRRLAIDTTKKVYATQFRGIRWFCALIGDYESMLIMEQKRLLPECLLISEKTIEAFCRMKTGKKGTPLMLGGSPQNDIFGNPVLCDSSWKNPKNMNLFLSAISTLHASRGNGGKYKEKCDACARAERRSRGCFHHAGNPLLFRRGNPRMAEFVRNGFQNVQQDLSAHTEHGADPFTPFELVSVRANLLTKNAADGLMLWTMILIGSRLFLRSDELLDLKFDSNDGVNCIRWDLCQVVNNEVVSIAFAVKGKSDPAPVILMLELDRQHRNLCPIRHLLAYLHVTSLKSGFFFPPLDELNKLMKGTITIGRTHLDYSVFLELMKMVVKSCITRDFKVGTHTLRKTAYLLAAWDNASDEDVRLSARHRDVKSATMYKRDSSALWQIAVNNGRQPETVTPKWRMLFVERLQIARVLNFNNQPKNLDLSQWADDFI